MSTSNSTGPFDMQVFGSGSAWCYLERGGKVSVYDVLRPGTYVGTIPADIIRKAAKRLPKLRKKRKLGRRRGH